MNQFLSRVLSFDDEIALGAATLQSSLSDAETSLDPIDLLIAATARRHGATLVTANKNDFDKRPIHELIDVEIVDVN